MKTALISAEIPHEATTNSVEPISKQRNDKPPKKQHMHQFGLQTQVKNVNFSKASSTTDGG
jgi:hypothetical protein